MKDAKRPSKAAVKKHLENMVRDDPKNNAHYAELMSREKMFDQQSAPAQEPKSGGGGAVFFFFILIAAGVAGWVML